MTDTPPPTTLSTPSPTEQNTYDSKQTDPDNVAIPSTEALLEMNTFKSAIKPITLIVATATKPSLGIGCKGQLPWPQIRSDMAFFRKATTGPRPTDNPNKKFNAVIMGRKTYDSIPTKFRPLGGRVNVILTRSSVHSMANKVLRELTSGHDGLEPAEYRFIDQATVAGLSGEVVSIFQRDHSQPTVVVTNSVESAVDVDAEQVFCIGGAEVYGIMLQNKGLRGRVRVLQTLVRKVDGGEFDCDTFWPEDLEGGDGWRAVGRDGIESWAECEVPQGKEEWKRDDKAGVEIQVVGWERNEE